jgi:pyrimidine-specific ribonucleoside hydrolase
MKKLLLFLFGIIINYGLVAHPWKPSHYVIIDTDGGIDDMRAITLLLASPDVRVLAITVSEGALKADATYVKVKSLLNSFYHEGIPVGINRSGSFKSPSYLNAVNAIWGKEAGISPSLAPDFLNLINDIIAAEKTKISFISLGSLSTAWQALNALPEFKTQVLDFIWSADGSEDKKGFNYNIDRVSANGILKQELPVKIVNSSNASEQIFYTPEFLSSLERTGNRYARAISASFKTEAPEEHRFLFMATDELVSVFLHFPDLFLNKVAYNVSDCTPAVIKEIQDQYLKILSGETVAKNQVIRTLPADPAFYFDDIRPSVTSIIEKYGIDEWTSGVIANELHRHLGVFAIIGVKMGIRAREYFNTGVDEFSAVSFAGSLPPLSCMNDGIQVSTGATPGHGLLTVKNEFNPVPAVEFTYLNRKIRLTLKPELAQKISSELREINFVYGLDSNIYWELVRKNSIRYWLELDRHGIFTIEETGK